VTISSYDRMVDVFPTVFDFKVGEQPSSRKLTKWVKLTDNAFRLVTQAVGDPWDYQTHEGQLSPQKLGQATIARLIGPSDYVGPLGETINSDTTSVEVSLSVDGASSWYLGFPLVKKAGTVTPQVLPSCLESLTASDLSFSGTGYSDYFVTLYSDPRDMSQKGDYCVDFARGVIQTYLPIDPGDGSGSLTVTISNLSFVGAGAPWATHNVIPIWEDGGNAGVTIVEAALGPGNYEITLPGRDASGYSNDYPRVGAAEDSPSNTMTGAGYPESDPLTGDRRQATLAVRPTGNVSYRLPYSLEANYSSGDVLPGGTVKLWCNSTNSFVALTEFEYVSPTTLKLTCPTLSDVDATGNENNYRLVVVGTSLAEQVSYLAGVVREGQGQGVSVGGPATFPSMSFSPPMSHDRLRDRYGFSLAMEESGDFSSWASSHDNWQRRFAFTESAYPTNPHPQYLHRAGYLSDDETANTSNAMRGWLCFAGYKTETSGHSYESSKSNPGFNSPIDEWTYGVAWGAGEFENSSGDHPRAFFDGGKEKEWSGSGPATRLGFGLYGSDGGLGFAESSYYSNYGALVYEGFRGQPFYVRGRKGASSSLDTSVHGGAIAMDLGDQNEMNYLKLVGGSRPSTGSYAGDPANDPAWIDASSSVFNTPLAITPGLSKRISAEQTRELRFRGVSYNELVQNAEDGIGSLSTYPSSGVQKTANVVLLDATLNYMVLEGNVAGDIRMNDTTITLSGTTSDGDYQISDLADYDAVNDHTYLTVTGSISSNQPAPGGTATWTTYEFNRYFRSPGIIGGDFLNVYGNAVFFSEEGDGKKTSFTDRGKEWLTDGTTTPSGLFYVPAGTLGSACVFVGYEGSGTGSYDGAKTQAYFGHTRGSWANSTLGVKRGLQFEGHDDSGLHVAYNTTGGTTYPASNTAEQGLSCIVYKVHGESFSAGDNTITVADSSYLPKCIRSPESGSVSDNFKKRVVGVETLARQSSGDVFYPLSSGSHLIGGQNYVFQGLYYYLDGSNNLSLHTILYEWDFLHGEPDLYATFSESLELVVKVWYLTNRPSITDLPYESAMNPLDVEINPL